MEGRLPRGRRGCIVCGASLCLGGICNMILFHASFPSLCPYPLNPEEELHRDSFCSRSPSADSGAIVLGEGRERRAR